MEPMQVMLEHWGLSGQYSEHALEYAAYIKNRLPQTAMGCSPLEILTGQQPTLEHIRVFGCSAFVQNNQPKSKARALHNLVYC